MKVMACGLELHSDAEINELELSISKIFTAEGVSIYLLGLLVFFSAHRNR